MGGFNTPLTAMDRSSTQKFNKATQPQKEILDQMDLTDIYRTFHPRAEEYTFFSSAYGTLRLITFWATNQDFVTLGKLKSHQASFQTTILNY